jgi:hypothetical protein
VYINRIYSTKILPNDRGIISPRGYPLLRNATKTKFGSSSREIFLPQ